MVNHAEMAANKILIPCMHDKPPIERCLFPHSMNLICPEICVNTKWKKPLSQFWIPTSSLCSCYQNTATSTLLKREAMYDSVLNMWITFGKKVVAQKVIKHGNPTNTSKSQGHVTGQVAAEHSPKNEPRIQNSWSIASSQNKQTNKKPLHSGVVCYAAMGNLCISCSCLQKKIDNIPVLL